MNFTLNKQTNTATSECGYYEIKSAFVNAKLFYNAYYLPTQRHLEAGHDKELVKTACENHAKRIAAQKASVTGASA